jgi:hypothetical protein
MKKKELIILLKIFGILNIIFGVFLLSFSLYISFNDLYEISNNEIEMNEWNDQQNYQLAVGGLIKGLGSAGLCITRILIFIVMFIAIAASAVLVINGVGLIRLKTKNISKCLVLIILIILVIAYIILINTVFDDSNKADFNTVIILAVFMIFFIFNLLILLLYKNKINDRE